MAANPRPRLTDLVDDERIRAHGYRHSPHLGQWWLAHRLQSLVLTALADRATGGAPPAVLEIGASHGSMAVPLLAAGARVTLIEATPAALAAADAACGGNDRYRGVLDPDLSLAEAPGSADLVLIVSALHHIPNYLALLDRAVERVRPGGVLLTLSDPLFYPRLPSVTRRADRAAYLAWRVTRGEVADGLAALRRRARGEFPRPSPDEIDYYHVVRQGVDEEAVTARLSPHFIDVELIRYWSNHFGGVAPLAERLGLANTFAVRATGRLG